jgi:hypothetical protein
MAEPTDMLAREIEEELRRERLLRLWDRYGTYILAVALAVVVGVGGYKFYESRRVEANETASISYIVGLRDLAMNKAAEGQQALEELAAHAPHGYATLSRLRLAGHDQSAGNAAQAIATYDEIIKDTSVDPILADYARLQIAMLKLDSADFTELKNRVTPLAGDKSPWRFSARELLGLGAYKAGLTAEARNHFQRLVADRQAPPSISERARIMLGVLAKGEQASRPASATQKPEPSAKPQSATKDETAKDKGGKPN